MSNNAMPISVAKRLGYAIKRAQHALRLNMDQALLETGLTMAQYAVLCALEAQPGLSNAHLARAAFVTAQTMQGVLANLERDGVIRRRPDPRNARVLRGALTAKGRSLLARAHIAVAVVEERLAASFGADAVGPLAEALYKCADDLASALAEEKLDEAP
jgi:DNA-binding MarR family transcriptional regulator